jgi:hypothetical protein
MKQGAKTNITPNYIIGIHNRRTIGLDTQTTLPYPPFPAPTTKPVLSLLGSAGAAPPPLPPKKAP